MTITHSAADGGNHQSGHAVHSVSHSLNIGNLSNDNMLGGDYQYWNLSNFMEGLKINPGIRFAILFIAFAGWLYIIYWVRHHEPFTNQMIGTHTYLAPTATQDKSMVAEIRNAFPWRTSANMGTLYVPSPETIEQSKEFTITTPSAIAQKPPQANSIIENRITTGPGQAVSAPIEYSKPDFDERFGLPANSETNYSQTHDLVLEPISPSYENNSSPIKLNTNLPDPNSMYTNYQIQIKSGNNNLLRTVVSR